MRKKRSVKHHSVYVIKLDKAVRRERKFVRANPRRRFWRPCVYVGLTGLDPVERFANHKRGYKANRYARLYGIKLLPRLYAHLNPMSYEEAREMEEKLAGWLRSKGYGVWQH